MFFKKKKKRVLYLTSGNIFNTQVQSLSEKDNGISVKNEIPRKMWMFYICFAFLFKENVYKDSLSILLVVSFNPINNYIFDIS